MNKPSHEYCKECKDWNGTISKCMEICGIPMDIIEEWDKYHSLGTPEYIKEMITELVASMSALSEYQQLGTVEELREARDKRTPQKPNLWGDGIGNDGSLIYDMWDCPGCGKSYEVDCDKYDYCPECGQAIDWSES